MNWKKNWMNWKNSAKSFVVPHSLLILVVFFLAVIPAAAKIHFSGLDLSEDNRLLFTAHSAGGGSVNQSALFMAQLPSRSVSMLSAFPEKMELINNGRTIIVHNAFGSQQLPVSGGLPRTFPGFSSLSGSSALRVESSCASPDGRWLLYVEGETHARGTLILLDGNSGEKKEISFDVERPGRYFPALWGSESRGFLYSKGGKLYFYSAATQAAPPDERYRIIGEGAIPSLCRGAGDVFYYLRSSTVYRIRSNELFARTLYSGFLDLGEVAGKIPFEFDPNFDRFWIAPDGLSLILCKDGRNLFYYPLGITLDTETNFTSLPSIIAPRSLSIINVLWPPDGTATVLIGSSPNTLTNSAAAPYTAAYRLSAAAQGAQKSVFETLATPPSCNAALSPDGSRVVFWGKDGLSLYDYRTWRQLAKPVSQPVYSALWLRNNELVAGGGEYIETISLQGNAIAGRKLVCFSAAPRYGFEAPAAQASAAAQAAAAAPARILVYSGNTWYATDGESPWTPLQTAQARTVALANSRYRVYLEARETFIENMPMIRNTTSVGTVALFDRGGETPFGSRENPSGIRAGANPSVIPPSSGNYAINHGPRDTRQTALCFDLYDDASGLSAVLEALNRYEIRATFFVNGEFIRRHPQAAKDLALSGHEIASMFYAPIDLSDVRYRIDSGFIGSGLARNEDEFYTITGKELALLWHPPFYALSREIAQAAAAAGYRSIGRDVDSRDWLSSAHAKSLGIEQPSAADIIDNITGAASGGSIIPLRLGVMEGGRTDYVFNSLEVLLDALTVQGFELVTVSALISHVPR